MEHITSVLQFFPKALQWPGLIALSAVWAALPYFKQRRDHSRYWAAVQQHLELVGKIASTSAGPHALQFVLSDSETFVRRLRPDLSSPLPTGVRFLWTTVGAAVPMVLIWALSWNPQSVFESPVYGLLAVLLHVLVAGPAGTWVYRTKTTWAAITAGAGTVLVVHLALALAVGPMARPGGKEATAAYGLVGGLAADDVAIMFRLPNPPQSAPFLENDAHILLPQLDRLAARGLVRVDATPQAIASANGPRAVRGSVHLTELGAAWKDQFLINAHAALTDPIMNP